MSRNDASLVRFDPTWGQRWLYRAMHLTARWTAIGALDLRVEGREHLVHPALIASTHQSLLDPVLVGLIANHKILYLARKSLFRNPLFGAFLRYNGVIPLDREGGGLAGLRQTLSAIQGGQSVLMFPEGTRTPDGSLQEVKPGFLVLARRAGVPVVPMAIVGAYDVLPRGRSAPGWHPVAMVVGKPLPPSAFQKGSDGESIARLQSALRECDLRARQLCGWKCRPEANGSAIAMPGRSEV